MTMKTKRVPNNEYKGIFDSIASRYDEVCNAYAVSRRRDIIVSWARGDCLEVGAGTGNISKELVKKCRVVATDISPNMISEIRKKLNIETRVCDAEKIPFPDNSFDTVVASECIYYLNNPQRFLEEAHRILRPKGHLLISSATNISKFYEFIRAFLRRLGLKNMYFDDKNRNFMNKNQLKKLLWNTGFRIIEIKRIIIMPFPFLDYFNRLLEKMFIGYLSAFILINSEKS